jgi:hypothetical protein
MRRFAIRPVWSRNGQMLFFRGRNGEVIAVLRLRQAGNVDEATRPLDDVEQSVITLRVLLWERKDSTRD